MLWSQYLFSILAREGHIMPPLLNEQNIVVHPQLQPFSKGQWVSEGGSATRTLLEKEGAGGWTMVTSCKIMQDAGFNVEIIICLEVN